MTRSSLAVSFEGAAGLADDLGVEVAAAYGDPASEERALLEGAGMVDRCARGSVLVTGPDALSYLQSLLSQDLAELADGDGAHALLLHPQGKLDTDLRLLRLGPEECRLDCEVGRAPALVESLRRFKIRVKADIEDTTGDWGCISLRGKQAPSVVSKAAGLAVPDAAHAHVAWPDRPSSRIVRADWPGEVPGVDVVGAVAALELAWPALVDAGASPAGFLAYEAGRVSAGVPRQGVDTDEKTIPQEAFLEQDAVSFTKGCFLGQELVCRIDTRGHVNRYLRGIEIRDDATPPAGAGILVGDKEVGRLTTVAASERGTLALGYVRREVEMPAEVLLRWETGEARASASALPERP